jgi:hypothetical protein
LGTPIISKIRNQKSEISGAVVPHTRRRQVQPVSKSGHSGPSLRFHFCFLLSDF